MNDRTVTPADVSLSVKRAFIFAWLCCTAFYFLEYAVRSAPAVMIPELGKLFGVSTLGVSSILGVYYYTYAMLSLVAGALLDHFGAKRVVPAGALVLAVGCLLFELPYALAGDAGRLLQGGGSAFAFIGAVYLASHGLPAGRLATAIGITQCVGMLGGSVGQLGVGPLVHGTLGIQGFWLAVGAIIAVVALSLFAVTPTETRARSRTNSLSAMLQSYKVVFGNPQSYLCGLVAGLLFAPTTIADMVWGVRFLEQDTHFRYQAAVFSASMVPLGWVVGCPAIGWLADYLGRRKPALLGGMVLMLLCVLQFTFARELLPTWLTLFIFGCGSGAAMIPYSIIKEVNPDRVKGSATGAMNFLTFSVTAALGPLFARIFASTLATSVDHAAHLRHANFFWITVIAIAIATTLVLRETGTAARLAPGTASVAPSIS
jgi:MFS family permease